MTKKVSNGQWLKYLFLTYLGRSDDCPPKTGPYQDYPYFRPSNLEEIRGFWKKTLSLIKEGLAPKDVGIYIHWPFCPSQCTFCFCSMKVPHSAAEMRGYVDMLKKEMDAFKDIFKGTSITSIWIGGGTPTFISDGDLDELLAHLRSSFDLEKGAQFYVESSPATLTESKLQILLSHGVNRITLGVQSLDDKVIRVINRVGQTRCKIENILNLLEGKNVITDIDLVMGLEGQSKASFFSDIEWVLKVKPDVLHIYGFDPRPHTLFAQLKKIFQEHEWENPVSVMDEAEKILTESGYRHPFWLPGTDELEPLEEKQCGGMTKVGASILGLGHVAQSHAFGGGSYQHRPLALGFIQTDKIPDYICFPSDREDEMWQYVVRNFSRFHHVSRPDFKRIFKREVMEGSRLSRALRELELDGYIRVGAERIDWNVSDALTRQAALRHLYSPNLIDNLLRFYEKDYRHFLKTFRGARGEWEKKIRDKIEIISLERIYLNEGASRGGFPAWGSRVLSGR